MIKSYKYIWILLGFVSSLTFSACDDDIDPVVEELPITRVFAPSGIEADITDQTTVTITWNSNKNIDSYQLEISQDNLEFTNIIESVTLEKGVTSYTYDLPAGDTQYSARIMGLSETLNDSKWVTVSFESLPENLFYNYDLVMNGLGDITLSWTPGKQVTSMVFVDSEGQTAYDLAITPEELAAGVKNFPGLANDLYTINLMNGSAVRGTQKYVLEGDILLEAGGDLAAAISAAASGNVIVLQGGESYGFVGDLTIDKSLKIKGIDGGEMPVMYTTSGDRMFFIGSTPTVTDSLVFENLYMSGYVNYTAGSQIRGVFDMESEACNIGAVKFLGCKIYDMGRQIMRLRGGSDQTIGEFVIDDCIIHNLGSSSSSYGVLCATETNTNVTNIKVTNSTIDSLKCHFIRYDDATACENIVVENCTFNKVPYSSGRYLMDIRNVAVTDGVQITNCIFGTSTYGDTPSISGVYYNADITTLTVSDSYATTDFVNTGYSIVELCTSLGVASTDIFTDPDNGDFTLTDGSLDAGDPRWR
ncbi:DUF5123 domain-containing protein [Plebeiibacterium sediminum]|uniref:Fibronectin type III domain-containing protein n=1 Tax=Plebeiibacterium sediminum TaxID=2992112 RepID=A0AAE3M1J1_9BACT|nr:DUF5123 domain-containing protein [Plebeiobacterium sediminum]MCW3785591.1 fibronectin type III domain-containing protein [Plebeiobacterium sediminum]